MNQQPKFWSLVKHETKFRKERRTPINRQWRAAYAVAVAVVIALLTTFEGHRVTFDLNNVWYFTFGLPFLAFGLATGRITHEWKNATAGWWLSLPMSRVQLVSSKFVGTLAHAISIFARIYCVIAILGIYTMFLNGTLTAHVAGVYLLTGIKWNILLICVLPFVSAFGVLVGAMTQSVIRQATPILWIVFSGGWWLIFSRDEHFLHLSNSNGAAFFTWSPTLLYPLAGSWILAYLLVRLAAYILGRHAAI